VASHPSTVLTVTTLGMVAAGLPLTSYLVLVEIVKRTLMGRRRPAHR
jgi:hypothetical protein